MARKRIEKVHLQRQPHRDGLRRLQLAYRLLLADAQQATDTQTKEKQSLPSQEVEKCP